MPTYSYECKKCGEIQDKFHGISAKPRVKCESCGGSCKKLLGTGSGVIFKGSGFYETDYKSKGGGAGTASKSDSGKGGSESKSDSGGDSAKSDSTSKSTAKAGDK